MTSDLLSRPAHYRTVALDALVKLTAGDDRPKTLHRLRTHLRRLQAYLELVGEAANADVIAKCVSYLSELRTLHVFERYLVKREALKADLTKVRRRLLARHMKIEHKDRYRKIERVVHRHALPPTPADPDWLAERLLTARHTHAEALRPLLAEASVKPRRKLLHKLRLRIKAIRYQEEWALGQAYARPEVVQWLKHAQSVLGKYEEGVQLRKLAQRLDLRSLPAIRKDLRRARKNARALVAELADRVDDIAGRQIHLLPSLSPSEHAAS